MCAHSVSPHNEMFVYSAHRGIYWRKEVLLYGYFLFLHFVICICGEDNKFTWSIPKNLNPVLWSLWLVTQSVSCIHMLSFSVDLSKHCHTVVESEDISLLCLFKSRSRSSTFGSQKYRGGFFDKGNCALCWWGGLLLQDCPPPPRPPPPTAPTLRNRWKHKRQISSSFSHRTGAGSDREDGMFILLKVCYPNPREQNRCVSVCVCGGGGM